MALFGFVGAGVGSTTILYVVVPPLAAKTWSREAELMASRLPWASTLFVLSRSVQLAPPFVDRRMPMPWDPSLPLPVAAKMIDCLGSLFRGKMAMLPMWTAYVGPKSVSGIQVGPLVLLVRKFVVFQTPPAEAPM